MEDFRHAWQESEAVVVKSKGLGARGTSQGLDRGLGLIPSGIGAKSYQGRRSVWRNHLAVKEGLRDPFR